MTDNLDRGYRKRKLTLVVTSSSRKFSGAQIRFPGFAANSLFRNILPVTCLESRFCKRKNPCLFSNPNEMNRLQNCWNMRVVDKSLFRNILPITYLESRFYQKKRQIYSS